MIPIVDLFAGPGGLNEGFSSIGEDEGQPVFRTVASFEMNKYAHGTLLLRTAYRIMKRAAGVPSSYYRYVQGMLSWPEFAADPTVADALAQAREEVHLVELGEANRSSVDATIRNALAGSLEGMDDDWVLIGGPPCQAYSLAGRSRRKHDEEFENDHKHFLYKEYLHIIEKFRPTVFVMENVKGLLSSTNKGSQTFDLILRDLSEPSPGVNYEIRSLVVDEPVGQLNPKDFVIRAEDYGIPQKRHRVILLGIRADALDRTSRVFLEPKSAVTVNDAIGDLPRIRSTISPAAEDSPLAWSILKHEVTAILGLGDISEGAALKPTPMTAGGPFHRGYRIPAVRTPYQKWILDPRLGGVTLHHSRSHMSEDIKRYGYLAAQAAISGRALKLGDLPDELQPKHKNIGKATTPFVDRFRVQLADQPSSTVVSHISKDGHYYIHPDASQMRSLTVREAARLQTFPDNYFFTGSRTQQYHQVGNAVPPLLAAQIAAKVAETLRVNLAPSGQKAEQSIGAAPKRLSYSTPALVGFVAS
ncbi:DNA cytosine methyltransferase [Paenarthrobacter ureafaciens]|uniref:DNA cytosine methyltransferase n=1 Tax=Paenarthrobacter ureafaciens TaxID=37931 RepID=UPI002DBE741F|nr:DNA cytosine methyltransferase [Paenarthrobacter ureafaciens]MEC3853733.1 DNA cytosine methyltransferase [Paenarthrobacter ureafaciens]